VNPHLQSTAPEPPPPPHRASSASTPVAGLHDPGQAGGWALSRARGVGTISSADVSRQCLPPGPSPSPVIPCFLQQCIMGRKNLPVKKMKELGGWVGIPPSCSERHSSSDGNQAFSSGENRFPSHAATADRLAASSALRENIHFLCTTLRGKSYFLCGLSTKRYHFSILEKSYLSTIFILRIQVCGP
jgi:hypothetical protein